ncbi:hypothetical protein GCM10023168_29420 [Fodinibacter luteus]|uniref:Lsr2 DNA-binding domain-containing protein n=1 Tax=Fodinibacter luteus TaxID=552064 RepID=A0ABP8KMY7_9MICO
MAYVIDVTERGAKKFDKAMDFYTAHAQRQGGRRSIGPAKTKADRGQLQAVHEWAGSQGHTVSDRGRIGKEI